MKTRCKRLRQFSSHVSPTLFEAVLHVTLYFSEPKKKKKKKKKKKNLSCEQDVIIIEYIFILNRHS